MADKKDKALTVKEFKMWLEGVEEMQADGWTPNDTQWKRIREKINVLIEGQPVYQEMTVPNMGMAPNMPMTVPMPTGNPLEMMNINPAAFQTPSAPPPGAPFGTNSSAPVKTPNVDTSGGKPYKSSFA